MVWIFVLCLHAPLTILLLQAVINRTYLRTYLRGKKQGSQQKLVMRLCLVTSFASGALALWLFRAAPVGDIALSSLYVFLISGLFGYCYFHLYNMSETARRIRILVGIYCAHHGLTPVKSSDAQYDSKTIIANRLSRLEQAGSIVRQGDRYLARAGVMLAAAKFFSFCRKLYYPAAKAR